MTEVRMNPVLIVAICVLAAGDGGCDRVRSVDGPAAAVKLLDGLGKLRPKSEVESMVASMGEGMPVAVVVNDTGVVLSRADGKSSFAVIQDQVAWALIDNSVGVLWFGTRAEPTEIRAKDFNGTGADIVTVVRDAPSGAGIGLIRVSPEGKFQEFVGSRSAGYDGYAEITMGAAQPQVKYVPGLYDQIVEAEGGEVPVVKPLKLTPEGLDFINTLVNRRGSDPAVVAEPRQMPRVTSVPVSDCEDQDICGTADEIPGTGLWRVAVSHSCGDACHLAYQLHDPATSGFLDLARPSVRSKSPLPEGASFSELWVSADGAYFMIDGKIFQRGKGEIADFGDGAVGWLGGGVHLK